MFRGVLRGALLALGLVATPALAQTFTSIDLAKESTATTGDGATLVVGGAVSGFLTIEAAATQAGKTIDEATVHYGIVDGNDRESGIGSYDADTNTLTRCTSGSTCTSTNSGNRIDLSGSAQVGITAIAASFDELWDSLTTKLENVVEDTSPELGGNLDAGGFDITDVGDLFIGVATGETFEFGNSDIVPGVQFHERNLGVGKWANDANGHTLTFAKSRGATPGTFAIVQDNDSLGGIAWNADDGVKLQGAAYLTAQIVGTPGAGDVPTELHFGLTRDNLNNPTDQWVMSPGKLYSVGASGSQMQLFVNANLGDDTEYQYPTSAGDITHAIQVNTTNMAGGLSLTRWSDSGGDRGVHLSLFKANSNEVVGDFTLVDAGENYAEISFGGSDGAEFLQAGYIRFVNDNDPGPGGGQSEPDDAPASASMSGTIWLATTDAGGGPQRRWAINSIGTLFPYTDDSYNFAKTDARPANAFFNDVDIDETLNVQGEVVVFTADPGADAFYGFDDTADQYEALTAAEAIDILETADGAGSGLDADTLDGVSSAGFLQDFNFTDDAATAGLAITEAETMTFAGDSAGIDTAGSGNTLTINFDVTEAEANIEAAIDTLANLTSIQSLTVTLADAGADAVLGWDDTASAYENLTAAEVVDIIETADGTGSGIDADNLDGQDWDGTTVVFADAGADAVWGWDDTAGQYENLTAAEIVDIVETADGTGSGLDADTVDGVDSTAFATTELDNLGTTAINTSLISDTDATDDLGSSTVGWNDLHLGAGGIINLDGGDVTLTHSANTLTITGGVTVLDDLSSIGGSTFNMADNNLDQVLAWDDTAGQVIPIPLATITAEASPTSGDFFLMYGAEGDLRRVDFDDMPGAAGGISNVVEDTSPQAGGAWDWNGQVQSDATLTNTLVLDYGENEVRWTNDAADAVGVVFDVHHDSATPADGDLAFDLNVFAGADDEEVGRIALEVDDGATTTEDTRWRFFNDVAGSSVESLTMTGALATFAGAVTATTTVTGADVTATDDGTIGDDLLLTSDAAVISIGNAADVTITHSSNALTIAGGVLIGGFQLNTDLDADGNNIDDGGVIFLIEQADADGDVAGSGQIWVDTATPNVLMFTDDAGTDFVVSDADLSAIAALTTTAAGRDCLTLADSNLDELVAWDDSAGACETIALADITTEASPAAGDFLIVYLADGNLAKVDWDDLPAGGGLPADPGADSFLVWDETTDDQAEWASYATTEAIIEPLIDTLANLTSIQSLTVTLADAGADAIWGWDDTAAAYENLTAAEVVDIIETADGTGSGLDADTVDGANPATTTLNNLGSVAVNTSIISDTDSTDNLGSSSVAWASLFVDNVEFGAATDQTLNCASGSCTIEGNLMYRAGGTDVPLTDGGTGASTASGGFNALSEVTSTTAGKSILDVADPGADRVMAWDDTAGDIAAIALADITDEGSPAAGDFILVYGAEGDLRRVDWDDLPGGSGIAEVLEDTSPQLGGDLDTNAFWIGFDDADGIEDENGNEQLVFQTTASAVNYLEITNAATGGNPSLSARGESGVGLTLNADVGGSITRAAEWDLEDLEGLTVHLGAGNGGFNVANFYSEHEGVGATVIRWNRVTSAGGVADGDNLIGHGFYGVDDGGGTQEYAEIRGDTIDVSAGSEDGEILISTAVAGSEVTQMRIRSGVIIGDSGTDPGADSLRIDGSGVIEFGASATDSSLVCASGECSIEGDKLKQAGVQTIWIPAGSMNSHISGGAACGTTYDSGATDFNVTTCNFDTTSDETVDFYVRFPISWNEGTVTFQPVWLHNGAGASGETVDWELSCNGLSNNNNFNPVMGTPQASADTALSDGFLAIGPESAAITCDGVAADDLIIFNLRRDVSDDNLADDAILFGIHLFFTDDDANDD